MSNQKNIEFAISKNVNLSAKTKLVLNLTIQNH